MIECFVPQTPSSLGQTCPPDQIPTGRGGCVDAENKQPFDRYSFTHAAAGGLFALGGFGPVTSIGAHVTFEALENSIKTKSHAFWPDSRPDSLAAHAGDVASFSAGYFLGRALLTSPGGAQFLTLLVFAGIGVWTYNVAQGHSWVNPPG